MSNIFSVGERDLGLPRTRYAVHFAPPGEGDASVPPPRPHRPRPYATTRCASAPLSGLTINLP